MVQEFLHFSKLSDSQKELWQVWVSTAGSPLTSTTAYGYPLSICQLKDVIPLSSLLCTPFNVTLSWGWTTWSGPPLATGGRSDSSGVTQVDQCTSHIEKLCDKLSLNMWHFQKHCCNTWRGRGRDRNPKPFQGPYGQACVNTWTWGFLR